MLQNSKDSYGLVAQGFHWMTALLILTLLPLGLYMHELPQSSQAEIDDKIWLFSLHKTLGMTAFVVAVLRVLWALRSVKPGLLNPDHKMESLAAEVAHWLLYISMIAVPVLGWLHHAALEGFAPIWGPFPQQAAFIPKDAALAHVFGQLHAAFAILMLVTVLAHIGGAMKHFVIDRDQTLQRMIPFAYKDKQAVPDQQHSKNPLLVALVVYAGVIVSVFVLDGQQAEQGTALAAADNSGWVVDHANSRLGISVTQMGSAVDGQFDSWTASINFDPAAPEAATIDAEIAIGSLTLGAVSKDALGAGYLDAANFATARYTSTGFTNLGGNQWTTDGSLDLHGVSQPVTLSFTLEITDGRAVVAATADLDRTLFGVGPADEGSVLKLVQVKIDLQADQAE